MIKKSIFSIGLLTLILSACQPFQKTTRTYVRDHEKDYLLSSLSAPLKIPNELSTPTPTENYPLPPHIPEPGSLKPVSLDPPGFGKLS